MVKFNQQLIIQSVISPFCDNSGLLSLIEPEPNHVRVLYYSTLLGPKHSHSMHGEYNIMIEDFHPP